MKVFQRPKAAKCAEGGGASTGRKARWWEGGGLDRRGSVREVEGLDKARCGGEVEGLDSMQLVGGGGLECMQGVRGVEDGCMQVCAGKWRGLTRRKVCREVEKLDRAEDLLKFCSMFAHTPQVNVAFETKSVTKWMMPEEVKMIAKTLFHRKKSVAMEWCLLM
ncbi:hypothetical protein CYMTET_24819 [Cymbomonas tetramitiformis]|uniref:Uncharacterized protein n=1 Tax=Cymbomonas tetramitiformis TaxID=36881 RepID=A0AAE0FVM2_9CHLO|nr:hypothetical protein CYMTET_24819 [Cymbomonas tetramitiformis]